MTAPEGFVVSFTGTSDKLTGPEQDLIAETIEGLKAAPVTFWSGAAAGVDVWAAKVAMEEYPNAQHCICIPYWRNEEGIAVPCPYDVSAVQELTAKGALTKHMPPGSSKSAGYMMRNGYLARKCTHMIAFPKKKKEIKRSGTWSTIRRARKLDRKVKVVPLSLVKS